MEYETSPLTVNFLPREFLSTLGQMAEMTRISLWERRELHLAAISTIKSHQSTCRWRRLCRTTSSIASLPQTKKSGDSPHFTFFHRRPCRKYPIMVSPPTCDKMASLLISPSLVLPPLASEARRLAATTVISRRPCRAASQPTAPPPKTLLTIRRPRRQDVQFTVPCRKTLREICVTYWLSLNEYTSSTCFFYTTCNFKQLLVSKWSYGDTLRTAKRHAPTEKVGWELNSSTISLGRTTTIRPFSAVKQKTLP